MYQGRIFVILVNYGGYFDTISCVESIFKCDDHNTQVIIIDNSVDRTSEEEITNWAQNVYYAKEHRPFYSNLTGFEKVSESEFLNLKYNTDSQIVLVTNVENRGFAAANNIALRHLLKLTNFHWVWLLNNDTVVPPDSLKKIREGIDIFSEDVGIVGTKLYYYNNPKRLQGVGGKYNKFSSTSKHVAANQEDYEYESNTFRTTVDYIIGASMIVRRKFIEHVGLMDESYFLYYEELDWALSGKLLGWNIDLLSQVIIYHKEGASISKNLDRPSLLSDKCSVVNRIKLVKKFYPQYMLIAYLSLIVVVLKRIYRGQSNRLIPILISLYHKNPLHQ